jgi:hypothetical protein
MNMNNFVKQCLVWAIIQRKGDHSRTANATAEAPSATAACHTRPSTTTDTAALSLGTVLLVEFVVADEVGLAELEVVTVVNREVVTEDEEVLGSTGAGADEEDAPLERGGAELLIAKLGAGTAVDGSARLPVPQGIGAFVVGWVGFVGSVVAPVGEAMAKRVVHVLLGDPADENW